MDSSNSTLDNVGDIINISKQEDIQNITRNAIFEETTTEPPLQVDPETVAPLRIEAVVAEEEEEEVEATTEQKIYRD